MLKSNYQKKLDRERCTKRPLDGLGMSPRPNPKHQEAIMRIAQYLNGHSQLCKDFFAITEAELGGPNSYAPDVLMYNRQTRKCHLFIEVVNSRGQSIARKKVPVAARRYNVPFALIYNYQTRKWYYMLGNSTMSSQVSTMPFGNIRLELPRIELELF
jgi:hypothetical protein